MLIGDIPRRPFSIPGAPDIPTVRCLSAMTGYVLVQDMTETPKGYSIEPQAYANIPLEHWDLRPSYWTTDGWTSSELTAALTKARSARFEFGETPDRPN